jgi:hypothetical protein
MARADPSRSVSLSTASGCWTCPPSWLPECGVLPGHGNKIDHDDAVSIELAALDANGLHEVALDDATRSRCGSCPTDAKSSSRCQPQGSVGCIASWLNSPPAGCAAN